MYNACLFGWLGLVLGFGLGLRLGLGSGRSSVWRQGNLTTSFSKCVMRSTVTEVTNVCQNDQLCAALKSGIGIDVHVIQYILE